MSDQFLATLMSLDDDHMLARLGLLHPCGSDFQPSAQSAVVALPNKSRPTLSEGDEGGDVKDLQKKLDKLGYDVPISSSFGSKTKAAVEAFQKEMDLKVTGKVDSATWSALDKAASKKSSGNLASGLLSFVKGATGAGRQAEVEEDEDDSSSAPPPEGPTSQWWFWPAVIGGSLVLVGGIVLIAKS